MNPFTGGHKSISSDTCISACNQHETESENQVLIIIKKSEEMVEQRFL